MYAEGTTSEELVAEYKIIIMQLVGGQKQTQLSYHYKHRENWEIQRLLEAKEGEALALWTGATVMK